MKETIQEKKGKLARVTGNLRYKEGTLTVTINYSRKHSKYSKIQNFQTRLQVQYDAKSPIELGTPVYIVNCRPYSKTKRWKIQTVGDNAIC